MLVFIDECGDAGFKLENQGSSQYFILVLVEFPDAESAQAADEKLPNCAEVWACTRNLSSAKTAAKRN